MKAWPLLLTGTVGAVVTMISSMVAAYRGVKNGAGVRDLNAKADTIHEQASTAATKADTAATKAADAETRAAEGVHKVEAVRVQAVEIKAQTDGQLSGLREQIKLLQDENARQHEENQQLHETIQQTLSIMAAREARAPQARETDNVPDAMKPPKTGNGDMQRDRRSMPDRRKKDTH